MLVKVKNKDFLVRDINTKAILNTNVAEYESYKNQKEIINKKNIEIGKLKEDVEELKNEFSEMKSILKLLDKNHTK